VNFGLNRLCILNDPAIFVCLQMFYFGKYAENILFSTEFFECMFHFYISQIVSGIRIEPNFTTNNHFLITVTYSYFSVIFMQHLDRRVCCCTIVFIS
jgi:uncharacterized membrane protein